MMSIKLTIDAWNCELPAGRKLVLLALCDLANDHGTCRPSVGAISDRCGMTAATTSSHLGNLERGGLITRALTAGGMRYTVSLPKDGQ